MKKLIVGLCAAALVAFTGCDLNENLTLSAVQAGGKLAMTAWFSIDDPGDDVKAALSEAVELIESIEVDGATYKEAVYPQIVKLIDTKFGNLDDFKKQLIESGAIIILGGIDQLFINNEKLATNRDKARKYISAFCAGVKKALTSAKTDATVINAEKAYQMRINSMKRRGVKKDL